MIENDTQNTIRIYQIDLFRFIAAFMVLLFHYLFRGYMADDYSKIQFREIGEYFKYGYLGVDLFFIISGFVIALSIKTRSVKKFCISRIIRLYPSYWLSVIIISFFIYYYGHPRFIVDIKQVIANLSMFQNYMRVDSVNGSYWSLFEEMKFYIFIILPYLIFNKFVKIKLDYLIYIWLLLTILYVFFQNVYVFKILNIILIFEYSFYFIAGMLFYQIYQNKLKPIYILLLCISLSLAIFHAISNIHGKETHYNSSFSPVIISCYIIAFYVLMLLISVGKLTIVNSSKLINIGLLTYPLYLFHETIGYIIFNYIGTEKNKYFVLLGLIVSMLSLSYLISKYYEPKVSSFLKLKLNAISSKYFKN